MNGTTLVYFSPTGTTRRTLEAVGDGFDHGQATHIDLTPAHMAAGESLELGNTLVLLGVPVYGGRVPEVAVARIRRLRGDGAPAAVIVVYGNRAYDDALLELSNLASAVGLLPVAGGAFVGEHSYSTPMWPIAAGRPDRDDLSKAADFGRALQAKLQSFEDALTSLPAISVPGRTPHRDWRMTYGIAPVVRGDCRRCGTCLQCCPVAACVLREQSETDSSRCIRCCACTKRCPAAARSMEDVRVTEWAETLAHNYRARREPEWFL